MSGFPWGRFAIFGTGLVGMGYALMKATTPTEEELYNRLAPDLKRKVDASRAARLAQENEIKKQVQAQVNDTSQEAMKPIWADPRSAKK